MLKNKIKKLMKKSCLILFLCLISYNANAGFFTYMQASDASHMANRVLNEQEQLNNKLTRIENEIIQLKNEIIKNRNYLIVINEHLKSDEKEMVKKPVSQLIIPIKSQLYTKIPYNYKN